MEWTVEEVIGQLMSMSSEAEVVIGSVGDASHRDVKIHTILEDGDTVIIMTM